MNLRQATMEQLNDYDGLVSALLACVRSSWATAGLGPQADTGTPTLHGPVNIEGRHLSFPESISAASVERDEAGALGALVKASVTYGMDVMSERCIRAVAKADDIMSVLTSGSEFDKAPPELKDLMNTYRTYMTQVLTTTLRSA